GGGGGGGGGGREGGADASLGRPFALAELGARLGALLRRGAQPAAERILRRGDVVVNFERRQAWVGGAEVPLTRRELDVLARLALGGGPRGGPDDLLGESWGGAPAGTPATPRGIVARPRPPPRPDSTGTPHPPPPG